MDTYIKEFLNKETGGKKITMFGNPVEELDTPTLLRLIEWLTDENKRLMENSIRKNPFSL